MLIAPPASGKSLAIKAGQNVVEHVEGLINQAPTSMTRASFVEYLGTEKCTVDPTKNYGPINAPVEAKKYQACTVLSEEFAGFIGHYDPHFAISLCNCLDAANILEEHRTGLANPRVVNRPIVSIAGAIQPSVFNELFPNEAWKQGLCTRLSFYYTTAQQEDSMRLFVYDEDEEDFTETERTLARELEHKKFLWGRIRMAESALKFYDEWINEIKPQTDPTHVLLADFNARRTYKLIQDACLMAISKAKFAYEVTREDFEEALAWQLESERSLAHMLDVASTSEDSQLLQEIVDFVLKRFHKADKTPISHGVLLQFVGNKVKDIYRADNYINHLVDAGCIQKLTEIKKGKHTIALKTPVYKPDPNFDGNYGLIRKRR